MHNIQSIICVILSLSSLFEIKIVNCEPQSPQPTTQEEEKSLFPNVCEKIRKGKDTIVALGIVARRDTIMLLTGEMYGFETQRKNLRIIEDDRRSRRKSSSRQNEKKLECDAINDSACVPKWSLRLDADRDLFSIKSRWNDVPNFDAANWIEGEKIFIIDSGRAAYAVSTAANVHRFIPIIGEDDLRTARTGTRAGTSTRTGTRTTMTQLTLSTADDMPTLMISSASIETPSVAYGLMRSIEQDRQYCLKRIQYPDGAINDDPHRKNESATNNLITPTITDLNRCIVSDDPNLAAAAFYSESSESPLLVVVSNVNRTIYLYRLPPDQRNASTWTAFAFEDFFICDHRQSSPSDFNDYLITYIAVIGAFAIVSVIVFCLVRSIHTILHNIGRRIKQSLSPSPSINRIGQFCENRLQGSSRSLTSSGATTKTKTTTTTNANATITTTYEPNDGNNQSTITTIKRGWAD